MPTTTLQQVWTRPALMIFTEAQPTVVNAIAGQYDLGTAGSNYIYLTDDNRSSLQVTLDRIEYKKRMINGRMRSYHVADKKTFSVSWKDLPSLKTQLSESRFITSPTGWARIRAIRDGTVRRNQMCATGDASSICPIRSRRTIDLVTSTPHFSQTIPL